MNNSTIFHGLYNEFAPVWGFHVGRLKIGCFDFHLSNNIFILSEIVPDKRRSDGKKYKTLYKTGNADEMRKYLTDNKPNK